MGARQSCSKACSNCTADCTRPSQGNGDEFDDERPGGDPAGATFEETLEDLNSLDRHLMLFCGTSNLSAVRWLLHLGAHWDACDANGTTCLHVACRSGALSIVKEMIVREELMQAVDVAGWTALHIAVLMGRREVVVRLLQAGASLNKKNGKGQMPTELCADSGTFEALRSYETHQMTMPGKPWEFNRDVGPGEDIIGSRLQYEPFFVPRQPVIRSQQYKKEFQKIGMMMFNRQPGYGLAFLVASGVARDYPVDMSTFLRRSKVDIKQVGTFLGEAFSLSHTIRLEFINSVVLQNTGVVSALVQVFRMLQLPDDLQKINRLVHGVARIWWRQHERMVKDLSGNVVAPTKSKAVTPALAFPEELVGLDLKQYLTSSDALHQLMFSSVLLHWYIYKDGPDKRRDMGYAVWRKLNECIEAGSTDIPEHVQLQVHGLIGKAFVPELAVATPSSNRSSADSAGGPDEGGGHGPEDSADRSKSMLVSSAATEGWAQIVGGGFPKPTGVAGGSQTVTYRHMSNIFSEVTSSSSMLKGPMNVGGPQDSISGPAAITSTAMEAFGPGPRSAGKDDFAWLSLCYTLLFFSAAPAGGAPYAFVELQKVSVLTVQPEARVLTLVGAPDPEEGDEDSAGAGAGGASGAGDGAHSSMGGATSESGGKNAQPVVIVLLLPDGRWQELNLPKLELRLPAVAELNMWSTHLIAACQGKIAKPPSNGANGVSMTASTLRVPPTQPSHKGVKAM